MERQDKGLAFMLQYENVAWFDGGEVRILDRRVYPAINIEASGTRKEELLLHRDELPRVWTLRKAMTGVPPVEAMEVLISKLKKVSTNAEFLMSMPASN